MILNAFSQNSRLLRKLDDEIKGILIMNDTYGE